jgi:hypothetical protein
MGESMTKGKPLRTALLIDADNVHLPALPAILPVILDLGTVKVCRIFGNLPKASRSGWTKALEEAGIPSPSFKHRTGKDAADFALTVDAVDLLSQHGFTGACLLSSDGHFVEIVRRLRRDGVKVHVFGRRQAANSLRRAADRFHTIDDLAARAKPLRTQLAAAGQSPTPH